MFGNDKRLFGAMGLLVLATLIILTQSNYLLEMRWGEGSLRVAPGAEVVGAHHATSERVLSE